MSDASQGPGWWMASDGRWYPPLPAGQHLPPYTAGYPPPYAAGYPQPYPPGHPSAQWGVGYPPYGVGYGPPTKTNGMAIASLVCSLAGILLFGLGSILGIIFGFVALGQINRAGGLQGGRGLAVAGIVIGFVVLALVVLAILIPTFLGVQHATNCNLHPSAAGCTSG